VAEGGRKEHGGVYARLKTPAAERLLFAEDSLKTTEYRDGKSARRTRAREARSRREGRKTGDDLH